MQDIDSCIQSIKTLMDEIAAASVQQSEMISLVETGIKEISAVVQDIYRRGKKRRSLQGAVPAGTDPEQSH